ncbi:hypothetical protein SAMN04487981_11723 [Streptomyces sp. cf386]|uniref:hypothetical protein n=1 Tax=Streptomyces sp. cf386 TaxID=1761904 RepID=UPI000880A348|nr:hypothetical protein [Streptomyces sp. cf386]SDP13232.1 hypothetical protein SAMN04487981_11723 [Streptomyces sp. cf386]
MNVLLCTACGHRLTKPLHRLSEVPQRPEYDGLPNPDGSRHAPPTVPEGAYVVDPEPCGAPYVPDPDPLAKSTRHQDGFAVNGEILVSAGPRGTLLVNPEDTHGRLAYNPASHEPGCCGAPGREGPNQVCGECGAVVGTRFSECYGPFETHFLPEAVHVEVAE